MGSQCGFYVTSIYLFLCDLPIDLGCLVKDSPATKDGPQSGQGSPGEGEWYVGSGQSAAGWGSGAYGQ